MFSSRPRSFARALSLPLTAALGLGALAACGSSDASESGRASVVAAFYPLEFLASRVGGTDVDVSTLTRPGAEPHEQTLTPKQVATVGKADLALHIKGVQPAVDKAVAQQAPRTGLDVATLVELLPAPHEEEHEGHGHEEEEESGTDPHLWLDPTRMATVATTLGDRLAKADPKHATGYKQRASALVAELTKLDTEFRTGLAKCERDTVVSAHAAFGYLTHRYKLKQVAVAGIDPSNEPTPKRLGELTHTVKESGVTTVFTETLASPEVAQALARSAGVKTAVLDPVEGIRPGTGGDYLTVMRANLAALRPALGCA